MAASSSTSFGRIHEHLLTIELSTAKGSIALSTSGQDRSSHHNCPIRCSLKGVFCSHMWMLSLGGSLEHHGDDDHAERPRAWYASGEGPASFPSSRPLCYS